MSKAPLLNDQEVQDAIDGFIEEVSRFFNQETVEETARESRFVERESKLTGHLFLSVFTFGMSIYGTPSLNQLLGLLKLVAPALDLSREGLHLRINEQAVKFFESMLSLGISLNIPKCLDLSILQQFARVLIFDSTSFQLPDELKEHFRGNGGDASDAAIKILFGYDLKSMRFFYVILDGTSPDHLKKYGLIDKINENDLDITDLGFFKVLSFTEIDLKGAFYLSRLSPSVNIYRKNEDGELEEIDLVAFLKKLELEKTEIEIYLKSGKTTTKTRLLIEKVPAQVKAQRLRKYNKINQKKGTTTSKRTKVLAGFNLHITNAPEDRLKPEHVRPLYGIRWQIELIFKTWKSNFFLDEVNGERHERIRCMIFAKLLLIFVSTKFIGAARSYAWINSKREVSLDQATKHIKIIAQAWLKAIVTEPENVKTLLKDAFDFIVTRCLKGRWKQRTYPLELLEKIELETLA